MALQINVPLTTNQGFAVPSGAYVWVLATLGNDLKYEVKVTLIFYKDKAAFDAKMSRFNPAQIPDTKQVFIHPLTLQQFADLDMMTIHNFIKADLETVLGVDTVTIVA